MKDREAPTRAMAGKTSLLRRVHRSLRGRYLLALLAVLAGTAAGGFLAWKLVRPLYQGTASIYINPVAPGSRGSADQSLVPLFDSFVASQVEIIRTGKVTRRAVETDVWRAAGGGSDAEALRTFEERRAVDRVAGTHIVQVTFVDPDPDVAVAGVRALIEAYQARFEELHDGEEEGGSTGAEERSLAHGLREGTARLRELTVGLGGVEGLEIRHRAAVHLVMRTEDALRSVRSALEVGAAERPSLSTLSPVEIAVVNEQMAEYVAHLATKQAEEKILAKRLGYAATSIIELRSRIAVLEEGVEDLARRWNEERVAEPQGAPTRAALKAREQGLLARLETLEEQSTALGKTRGEATGLQAENEELDRALVRMEALDAELASRPARRGRIQIADPGTRPTSPYQDRRATYAAIAAAVGGLLGFLIVLLVGRGDRRLGSAVGADDILSRVRSLGLLPALPTDPDDAEEVRIATHFTHQIRTLLEIAHARRQGACICISSPADGSGKTTLAAALALSFGSTGSRTLLVDADLSKHGLTQRVIQLLVHRARSAGTADEKTLVDATERSASPDWEHHLLEPLVLAPEVAPRPGPEELAELLKGAIGRVGLQRARETGLVEDLFSLADLLESTAARNQLALSLMDSLASEGELTSGSPAAWIPTRAQEIGFPAMARADVAPHHHLHRTGIDAIRFLPVHGEGLQGGASIAMMAGILNSLRDQFDIVLVDVGPVPGTDETSLVALQADSVVLVVSPEDRGPDAERALVHLEEIGARIAGVVYNRADQQDILKTGRAMYVARPS